MASWTTGWIVRKVLMAGWLLVLGTQVREATEMVAGFLAFGSRCIKQRMREKRHAHTSWGGRVFVEDIPEKRHPMGSWRGGI